MLGRLFLVSEFKKIEIGSNSHIIFDGMDTVELVKKFGTPLYVMSEDVIRENCRLYKNAFQKYYEGNGQAIYASKALSCLEMCRIINEEGLGLDVVSGGEIYTAIKSGFPVEKICFHGNCKTVDELSFAIENRIGLIIVDNIFELEIIDGIARKKGIIVNIGLRIKPGVSPNTNDFISTGGSGSKFGFDLESGEAMEAIKFANALQNVGICQLHCHIGSQVFEITPFIKATERMMRFINDVNKSLQIKVPELNLGGGFGIRYTRDDPDFDFERCMSEICNLVKVRSEQYGFDAPKLIMEPGRSIVGDAGITLYKIGSIKELKNGKTIISIDGGMADNPRHILYDSKYEVFIANKADKEKTEVVTVSGKCCESGDIIAENVNIPSPDIDDVVAVMCTGAYNFSMASNYNRIPRPPIIMVKDKVARVIVKRESYDDIIKNDL